MRKLCVIVMTAVLYAGCATSPDQEPERRLSLLEQADAKLAAPDYRGAVSLYFRDPDGNLGELVTPGLWANY